MTPVTLAKRFPFSASFSRNNKIIGHNYCLVLTTPALDDAAENRLVEAVNNGLIRAVHSRDLSLHVDFLKNVEITDKTLLEHFWPVVEKAIAPVKLLSLALERDSKTETQMTKHHTVL